MSGQIKGGEGTLIGNAGEFYVVAELLRRGVVAAPTPRNTPAFDVLATKGPRTVRIRVKTKSAQYTDWQWMAKKDGTIFRQLGDQDDFTVLVNLTPETRDLMFFVVPTPQLNDWLIDDYETWVRTPGKKGQPHDPTNKKRHLNYPRFAERLLPFANGWARLWT